MSDGSFEFDLSQPAQKSKDPYEKVRQDFKNFLKTIPDDCKKKLKDDLDAPNKRIDTIQFYSLDSEVGGEPLGYKYEDASQQALSDWINNGCK